MSSILYKYTDIRANESNDPKSCRTYDTNLLKKNPDSEYFENLVTYTNNESGHIKKFECAYSSCPTGFSVDNRCPQFTVIYVSGGALYCNGLKMMQGDAMFIDPYLEHRIFCEDEPAQVYLVRWEGDVIVHLAQMLRSFSPSTVYRVGFNECVTPLIDSIIYNRCLEDISIRQLVIGFTDMMLAYLMRGTHSEAPQKKPADLIARAKSVIESGYSDLTVDKLASILYVNSKYLSKMFHKYMGTTPKRYITETKMTHAEHYLISTEYPIQKVSEIVGYNNYTNFYVAFKNKYGISPEEYRRLYSDTEGAPKEK